MNGLCFSALQRPHHQDHHRHSVMGRIWKRDQWKQNEAESEAVNCKQSVWGSSIKHETDTDSWVFISLWQISCSFSLLWYFNILSISFRSPERHWDDPSFYFIISKWFFVQHDPFWWLQCFRTWVSAVHPLVVETSITTTTILILILILEYDTKKKSVKGSWHKPKTENHLTK